MVALTTQGQEMLNSASAAYQQEAQAKYNRTIDPVNPANDITARLNPIRQEALEQALVSASTGAEIGQEPLNISNTAAQEAVVATQEAFDVCGVDLPIMLSCTITDMSGRNLSGQTIEAFWYSVRHAKPFSIGLNCAFGAEHLRAPASQLSKIADTLVCVYPNAGLPNEMGEYDEAPEVTGGHLGNWAHEGLLNMVGGCCGTTPDHIKAIADAVNDVAPRAIPSLPPVMRLAGIDPVTILQNT